VLVFNYKAPFSVVRSRYLRNAIRPNGSLSCEYLNLVRSPVLAVPVAVAKVAEEEPLRVPEGSIPVLSQPLGSNIRHILEDIEMMSDDSVGLAGDNIGTSPKAAEGFLEGHCP
jgi:hypothetical protein